MPTFEVPAVRALLNYMVREGVATSGDIATAGETLDHHVSNFMVARTSLHAEEIWVGMLKIIRKSPTELAEFIRPLVDFCYPNENIYGSAEFGSPNDIFFRTAQRDPATISNIENTYAGIFEGFRYAAHINVRAEAPGSVLDEENVDAWMVYSAMEIHQKKLNEEFPRFQMLYRPSEKHIEEEEEPFSVSGIIVPVVQILYFIGMEIDTDYPIVMMTRRYFKRKRNIIRGLIIRHHELGKMISSKVVLRRTDATFEELSNKVDLVHESIIIERIKQFKDDLLNTVQFDGKGTLNL